MEGDLTEIQCVFRNIGSYKLVFFESANILNGAGASTDDMTLGDISNQIVNVLLGLRARRFRFGFICDHTAANSPAHKSGNRGVTNVLDALLSARRAEPDFWITLRYLFSERSLPSTQADALSVETSVITRVLEWYAVDKDDALFVSGTSTGARAAIDAGLTTLSYFSRDLDPAQMDRASFGTLISSPVITDEQQLVAAIEESFGQNRQRTV